MCARFRGPSDLARLAALFGVSLINYEFNPNVAPTEMVPAFILDGSGKPKAQLFRFGINFPAKDGKKRPPLLNARTDSLRRGSFKTILAKQRCIVPADGFYEFREEEGKKQPYLFYRHDGQPLLFACIWDFSEVKGDRVPSFAILTDEPNELVAPFHDRMPVAVEDAFSWLNLTVTPLNSLVSVPLNKFRVRSVSQAVNKVSEKDIIKIDSL